MKHFKKANKFFSFVTYIASILYVYNIYIKCLFHIYLYHTYTIIYNAKLCVPFIKSLLLFYYITHSVFLFFARPVKHVRKISNCERKRRFLLCPIDVIVKVRTHFEWHIHEAAVVGFTWLQCAFPFRITAISDCAKYYLKKKFRSMYIKSIELRRLKVSH